MPPKGIFQLKTPQDLLGKIRRDLERMRHDSLDADAAYDFFVTARHFPEWLYPDDLYKREALFSSHVELRVCRHLAEGAKHFEATEARHKQVADTSTSSGAWAAGVWAKGAWAPGVWADGLFITLDLRDSDTSALGSRISAFQLAERVVDILERAVI